MSLAEGNYRVNDQHVRHNKDMKTFLFSASLEKQRKFWSEVSKKRGHNYLILFSAVKCQPGTSQHSGWCVYCDRGTYQDSSGQSGCTPCPIGKTTDFVGARSEAECIGVYILYTHINTINMLKQPF